MLSNLCKAYGLVILANFVAAYSNNDLPDGVVHFALSKPSLNDRVRLSRRADSATLALGNQVSMYTAALNIGSNNQNVTVLVDTGSSDLWVMSANNPYCSQSSSSSDSDSQCQQGTQFDPTKSSSFSKNSTAFQISYGDGSSANGTYCQDTISYGGAQIKNANFAFVNETDSKISVFGIGLRGLESTSRTYDQSGDFSPTYANLPIQMKEQGIIKQNAYSLWLNDVEATSGSLLFGGVDHTKYNGTLQSVPILSSYTGAKPNEFQVKLDKISVYQGSNKADIVQCAFPALLDSGTTYMMLPTVFLDTIVGSIGGFYNNRGECFAACGLQGGLSFDFSGVEIQVPFSEFEFQLRSGSPICQLGMLPGGNTLVLGDTFLRSAYVVYDLDNYEVAMAPTNYNNTASPSIDAITSGIPSATQASGYSNTNVANTYSTSVATFMSGTKYDGAANNGDFTTSSFPTSQPLSGTNTGSYTEISTSGIPTASSGPTQSVSSSARSSKSSSGGRSKNAAAFAYSNTFSNGFAGVIITQVLSFLI